MAHRERVIARGLAAVAAGALSAGGAAAAAGGVVSLFDGKSTAGWVQRGGKAVYAVEDGALVGRTVLDTPNSFLCPPKEYADFVLEFEVWVDPKLNSGVQVRSESRPDYRNGVVHGYQIEIDPSERAWSGGIYDEQRRGWLTNPKDDPAAQKAFKVGEWNRYRVEASGDRLRTWINEVPVSDLTDGMTRSGFIGFQVHQAKEAGLVVRWRNIRIEELAPAKTGLAPNTLTDAERADGWQLLWDGHTTWGWRSAKGQEFPKEGWEIQDGVLSVVETGGAESRAGGDIVTEDTFAAFDLKAEFRLTPGANSGIKYYVDTELNKGEGSAIGLEYQLLDDATHPDAKDGRDGNRTIASLYDLIPAAAGKKAKPIGEWEEARIVSNGRHVEHWLNGAKVLEYERGSQEFRRLVAMSKYKVWPAFGERPSGPILLQDHGNRVSFRNVKIRALKPE
jgi:Domain of Unknown Function (DUF1080)